MRRMREGLEILANEVNELKGNLDAIARELEAIAREIPSKEAPQEEPITTELRPLAS